jgi:dihydrolipoamide dehydrogenase
MTAEKHIYDLVVIGAGPGGYVAAIRAAQLGLRVACIEKDSTLGGACLNVGCIPSKALLESTLKYNECTLAMQSHGINVKDVSFDLAAMMTRKQKVVATLTGGLEHLFKKNKISRILGTARLLEDLHVEITGEKTEIIKGKSILIATGSKVAEIPGIKRDGVNVISSTEALSLQDVPGHLVVIGAGAIGLEMGSVWLRLGAEVTVVEYLDRVLPGIDKAIAKQSLRFLKKQGMKFHLSTKVEGVVQSKGSCRVDIADHEPLTADKVLLAAGRKPNIEGLGFRALGGRISSQGFIEVDARWQTSISGIYAVGDVIGGAMLAHKASEEGIACVEQLVTGYGHVNYQTIPNIVYTHPEIASVGQTEESLQQEKVPFKTGVFYFKGNGRALAMDDSDGMVKLIAHKETDRILGGHIIGPRAGDLLAEVVVAMQFSASSEDLARTCHAHPTLSEVVREAALNVNNAALHG